MTLIGEGLVKIYHEELYGWISIVLGIAFIGLAVLVYFYFSQNLA